MVTFFLIPISVSAVAALIVGSVLLLLCVENRRFWKNFQHDSAPTETHPAKVNLIIPCTGKPEGARKNLEAFLLQDHPKFRIMFAIESTADPITPLIRELQREHCNIETKIVIAGPAKSCGQKVHNLLAAVEQIKDDVDIYAFADMDALVKPSWLRWLAIGVGQENCGARSGYRWMVPKRNNTPTLIGVNINNSIAACLGKTVKTLSGAGRGLSIAKSFSKRASARHGLRF